MTSISETGHAKNVANFEQLMAHCTGWGATYNPAKAAIKLPALQTQLTSAKAVVATINILIPPYSNAVAARKTAFIPFEKLITRANNALKASDTTTQVDDIARTLIRKLQGRRATPKKSEEEKKAALESGEEIIEISSSQMSFDNRLDNFDKLIKLLTSIAQYAPNEADLKVATLTTLYNDLKAKNTAVITAEIPLNNARIARNDLLYKDLTGLVDVALDVKIYIKSVYGATSQQYKQIRAIKFTKPR